MLNYPLFSTFGYIIISKTPNKHKGSIKEIKEGDILILKYQEKFIAYGRAVSSLIIEDIEDDWNHQVDVNLWIVGNHAYRRGIKDAQDGGSAYDTVKKVSKEFAIGKMEEIGFPF